MKAFRLLQAPLMLTALSALTAITTLTPAPEAAARAEKPDFQTLAEMGKVESKFGELRLMSFANRDKFPRFDSIKPFTQALKPPKMGLHARDGKFIFHNDGRAKAGAEWDHAGMISLTPKMKGFYTISGVLRFTSGSKEAENKPTVKWAVVVYSGDSGVFRIIDEGRGGKGESVDLSERPLLKSFEVNKGESFGLVAFRSNWHWYGGATLEDLSINRSFRMNWKTKTKNGAVFNPIPAVFEKQLEGEDKFGGKWNIAYCDPAVIKTGKFKPIRVKDLSTSAPSPFNGWAKHSYDKNGHTIHLGGNGADPVNKPDLKPVAACLVLRPSRSGKIKIDGRLGVHTPHGNMKVLIAKVLLNGKYQPLLEKNLGKGSYNLAELTADTTQKLTLRNNEMLVFMAQRKDLHHYGTVTLKGIRVSSK